jgi:hypothetical protein
MMIQLLVGELVKAEEYRLEPHAATTHRLHEGLKAKRIWNP